MERLKKKSNNIEITIHGLCITYLELKIRILWRLIQKCILNISNILTGLAFGI